MTPAGEVVLVRVDDVLLATRRMTHRWGRMFDGAKTMVVNGRPLRLPLVCAACLTRDDAPESDRACVPFPFLAAGSAS